MEQNTVIRCKFAGDPQDTACVDCNGIEFIEKDARGVEHIIPCTQCGGYEELIMPLTEPVATPTVEQELPVAENINSEPPQQAFNAQPVNNITEQEKCVISGNIEPISESTNETDILEITAGYGTSMEINGVWHRFDYSEKRKVNPTQDVNIQRNALWDDVIDQVYNLVDEAKKGTL